MLEPAATMRAGFLFGAKDARPEESPERSEAPLARNDSRPWRDRALAVQRDERSDLPELGVRVSELAARRRHLHPQGRGAQLLALCEPYDGHVPGPHGAARRRGSGAGICDGHGSGHQCGDEPGAGGRSYRRRAGAVRRLSLCGRGSDAALRRCVYARRWTRPGQFRARDAEEHEARVHRDADEPDTGARRYRGSGQDRQGAWRKAYRRQRVCNAALPAPAATGRRSRHLFGDQAYRWAGPYAGWCRADRRR